MGKKSIRVPFTEDASIAAFSQTRDDMLKLYTEEDMKGFWGNVIVPLHGDEHFYYRKVLDDNTMIICGECYSCSTEERFNEELGSYVQEHRFSDIGFIEEDSLEDDDGGFIQEETEGKLMEQNTNADSLPPEQDTETRNDPGFKTPELRAYVVYWDDLCGKTVPLTDEDYITEAEQQGMVYSIPKFQEAFNDDEINSTICSVRFLTV